MVPCFPKRLSMMIDHKVSKSLRVAPETQSITLSRAEDAAVPTTC